jgi:hypothetical protein
LRPTEWLLAGLLFSGLLSGACESKSGWEGRYVGPAGPDAAGAVTLTLQAGGKGQWMADQESTPLRWEERSGDLWLHLKTGGVMVARPIPGGKELSLELPGMGALLLSKAPS